MAGFPVSRSLWHSGSLCTDLAVSSHHETGGGQLPQAHRPVGVQLAGGDADLGAEPQLAAVVEAGGGVPEDAAGVDLADEALGERRVAGDDRFRVPAAVLRDVPQRLVEAVDDPVGALKIDELGAVF